MTNNETLKLYEKYTRAYLDFFNIKSFELIFQFDDDDKRDFRGQLIYRTYSKIATFELSKSWITIEKPSKKDIKEVSFHEACELLIHGLTDLAGNYYMQDIVMREAHNIIHTLLNTVYPLVKI